MQKNLVIVESPAKAKTIEKFLGSDYKVMSSYGHIRDLKKKEIHVRHTLAWITRDVAQGNTTMERATLRPKNSAFSAMAVIKPSSVLIPTTDTTQMAVFSITVPKAGSRKAARKLSRPTRPFTTPDLEISLTDSLNTMPMGKTTNTHISTKLGSSHR